MKVEIKILDPRLAELGLNYATAGSAAVDVRACSLGDVPLVRPYVLQHGETVKIGLGLAIYLGSMVKDGREELEEEDARFFSVASLLLPRSGLGSNRVRFANSVGLIDSDFQGQMMATMENAGAAPHVINPMDRIGQMAIIPVLKPDFLVVTEFAEATARGTGGFGSTGLS